MPLVVPAPGNLKAILINNNAAKTSSPQVDLILSAQGATQMMVSNDPDFVGESWEVFVTAKEWTVADDVVGPAFGDGNKTVYVKFTNGIDESDVYSATILLDTTPPDVGAIPIMINDGALHVSSRQVVLRLSATGATYVELFNEDELTILTGGTILPYSSEMAWTLSEGNGVKTVSIVFIDDIGNRSSFFNSSIVLVGQDIGVPVITDPEDGVTITDHFISVEGLGDLESDIKIFIEGEG